jgi:hypothetical protein
MMELDRVERGWGGRTTMAKAWVTLQGRCARFSSDHRCLSSGESMWHEGEQGRGLELSYRRGRGRGVGSTSARGACERGQCVLGDNCGH